MRIANIYESINGKKKVKFITLGIYELLKDTLGFRCSKINNRIHFLEYVNGKYKPVEMHRLKDSLTGYIKNNFELLKFNRLISFGDFMNEYYKQTPLKETNSLKKFLSDEFILSEDNKHTILIDIDPDYSNEYNKDETIKLLINHGFIETTDRIGNFYEGGLLFYKKISSKKFLIMSSNIKGTQRYKHIFDFWKMECKSEKDFLKKKNTSLMQIVLGFDHKKNKELFLKELCDC